MAYSFPALIPDTAPLTLGEWPTTLITAADGGTSTITTQSSELGRLLPLEFTLTNDEFDQLRDHWIDHGISDSFTFTTTTIPAFYTPAGYTWRWAEQPTIGDRHVNVRAVSCRFLAVPIPATSISAAPAVVLLTFTGGMLDTETTAIQTTDPVTIPVTMTEEDELTAAVTFSSDGLEQYAPPSTVGVSFITAGIQYETGEILKPLLLHFDGTPGSTAIVDSSTYNHTITRLGSDLSRGVISPTAFFGQSYSPSATAANPDLEPATAGGFTYLSVPPSNLFYFDGPFLISFRFRAWRHDATRFLFSIGYGLTISVPDPGHIQVAISSFGPGSLAAKIGKGSSEIIMSQGLPALNEWHHMFVTRLPSGMCYASLNGSIIGTPQSYAAPVGIDMLSSDDRRKSFYILADTNAATGGPTRIPGVRIDEFYIEKNGWVTDFTPPSTPYPNP